MPKLYYGQKGQVSFRNLIEYYYALGFLADNKRAELRWEHNEEQGAWGSEGRIHCLIPESQFPQYFKFTAGRGNIYARINCNDYVGTLVTEHKFAYNGKKNNVEIIKATVPEQYIQIFIEGYGNKPMSNVKIVEPTKNNKVELKPKEKVTQQVVKKPTINIKVGDKVQHNGSSIGKVKDLEEKYITIAFDNREAKFQFPNAFEQGFLKKI